MVSEIPLDIVLIVFECLDRLGERKALVRCSRVCRMWHHDARKVLASRAEIIPINEGNVPNEEWTEWHGGLMLVPAEPSYIVWLSITEDYLFDYNWLSAALACFPRLRHLAFWLTEHGLGNFTSSPPLPRFDLSLDSITLSSRDGTTWATDTTLDFLQCFPGAKSVHIADVFLLLPEDFAINCDITPIYLSITGCVSFDLWLQLLTQPRVAQAIRHFHFSFATFSHLDDEPIIEALKTLQNLEVLELDFWPCSLGEPSEVLRQCQVFQEQLAPALSAIIHTLSIRLPREREGHDDKEASSLICACLLNAMPPTIRRVEIRVGDWGGFVDATDWWCTFQSNKYFDTERLAKCFRRFRDLRTVEVVINKGTIEEIAEYRAFFDKGLPELVARGSLQLTSEILEPWPFWPR